MHPPDRTNQRCPSRQVAALGVPYAMMHIRGDPGTMTSPENTAYGDVATEVGAELQAQAEAALAAGIEPWRMLLGAGLGSDEGLGFDSNP